MKGKRQSHTASQSASASPSSFAPIASDIISNRIIKTELIEWKSIQWLQGELKSLSKESFDKLKQSLKVNNFIQPFNVWQNSELWCLDGHHRLKAMQDLEKDGITIPEKLPANFINCKDKKEAKKLVLIYSSIYARTSDESLYEYLHVNDLNFEELKLELDLPELDLGRFEEGWMKETNNKSDMELKPVFNVVIECSDEREQQEKYNKLLEMGIECRVLTL